LACVVQNLALCARSQLYGVCWEELLGQMGNPSDTPSPFRLCPPRVGAQCVL